MVDKKLDSDLLEKINSLEALVAKLISEKESKKEEEVISDDDYIYESIKISQDEYIKVISLCPMELNLSTEGMGKGKKFKFDKFGDVKRILYSDLVNIMESNSSFLNYGFFYIMDKRVIRKHGLDETYESILTKENIENVIELSEEDSVELFKSANKRQKEFICDMIIEKIKNEKSVNLNVVDRISRISGINLYEKGEESKSYSSMFPAPA